MRRLQLVAVVAVLGLGMVPGDVLGAPPQDADSAVDREQSDTMRNANMRSRRRRRRDRRRDRRARWQEMERDRQATERERLRTQRAQAEADRAAADAVVRTQPASVQIVGGAQPVVVNRFRFDAQQVQQQSIALTSGFMPDPYPMNGFAAGRISSRRLGLPAQCSGFWTNQPQHYVTLPQGMNYFRVDVTSNVDTTLAIVTPDGQVWCDDDSAGNYAPRLEGQFPAGTYAVYVGTYERGHRANYTVQLSERRMQQPQVQAQPQQVQVRVQAPPQQVQVRVQQAPPPPPTCRTVLLQRGHHASNLVHCRGAEPYCAASLLNAGHHPSNLVHCQGVPAQCAVTLLQQGHHPTNLVHCQGVEPSCADNLLRQGQHPANLVHCQ